MRNARLIQIKNRAGTTNQQSGWSGQDNTMALALSSTNECDDCNCGVRSGHSVGLHYLGHRDWVDAQRGRRMWAKSAMASPTLLLPSNEGGPAQGEKMGNNPAPALTMTRGSSGVMAEPTLLPQRTEFQRERWHLRSTIWQTSARLHAGHAVPGPSTRGSPITI